MNVDVQTYLHEDFLAQDLKTPPMLIEPIVASRSVVLLFGAPSSGKTLFAWTLALAVANGENLFGEFKTRQARIVVIQADMPIAMYQERLRASGSREAKGNILHAATDGVPLDVAYLRETSPLIKKCREFEPSLVIVDTLRKTHVLKENEAETPDRVYGKWRMLFPQTALLFLHHTRKVPTTQILTEDVIIREAFRGNTAWAAGADTLIMLQRMERKKEWLTRLNFVRTRGCEEPPSMSLRRTVELLLEPVEPTPTQRLTKWLETNPNVEKAEAVGWLQGLQNERGEPLCSRATAYRIYEQVLSAGIVSHAAKKQLKPSQHV